MLAAAMPFEFWFRAELTRSSLSRRLPQSRVAGSRRAAVGAAAARGYVFGDGRRACHRSNEGSGGDEDGALRRRERERALHQLTLARAVGGERDAPLDPDLDRTRAEVHRHDDALAPPPRPCSLRGRELDIGATVQVGELAAELDQVT